MSLVKISASLSELHDAYKAMRAKGLKHIRKNVVDVGTKEKVPGNMMYQVKNNKNAPRRVDNGNMPKAVYIKGDVGNSIKGIVSDKKLKTNGKTKKATNLLTIHHEANEGLSASKGEHTMHGIAFGHPNLGQIIGKESNMVATGDKHIKRAGKIMQGVRKRAQRNSGLDSHEDDAIRELMPVGANGKKHPFEYGKTRLNRRMREQIMKKEMGLSGHATKNEYKKALSVNKKAIKEQLKNAYGD